MTGPALRRRRRRRLSPGRVATGSVLELVLVAVTVALLTACAAGTSAVPTAGPGAAGDAAVAGSRSARVEPVDDGARFGTSLIPTPPTSAPIAQRTPSLDNDAARRLTVPTEGTPTTVPDGGTAAPVPPAEPAPVAVPAPALTIAVTDLGPTLVDEQGRTVYVTGADAPGGPGCGEGCLGPWTLVEVGPGAGPGVDPALIDSRTRLDGTEQLFYAGWPLYRLTGEGPGTVLGHRAGGQWFALDGTGRLHA